MGYCDIPNRIPRISRSVIYLRLAVSQLGRKMLVAISEAVMRVRSATLAIFFVAKLDQPEMADRMFRLTTHVGVRLHTTCLLPRSRLGITTRDDQSLEAGVPVNRVIGESRGNACASIVFVT